MKEGKRKGRKRRAKEREREMEGKIEGRTVRLGAADFEDTEINGNQHGNQQLTRSGMRLRRGEVVSL